MLEGGCACGQVRYRLTGAPIFVNCCHCRQCQKLGGSAFALNAMIESDRVELTEGEAEEQGGEMRCPACRTLLWAYHDMFGAGIRFVRVGTLDEGERLPPQAHFFVRSKHGWINVPDGMPRYDTLPSADDAPLWSDEARARMGVARG